MLSAKWRPFCLSLDVLTHFSGGMQKKSLCSQSTQGQVIAFQNQAMTRTNDDFNLNTPVANFTNMLLFNLQVKSNGYFLPTKSSIQYFAHVLVMTAAVMAKGTIFNHYDHWMIDKWSEIELIVHRNIISISIHVKFAQQLQNLWWNTSMAFDCMQGSFCERAQPMGDDVAL